MVKIKAIIAISQGGAIGNSKNANGLPWESISEDFKHFQRESKLVRNVFMGRVTFETILKLSKGKLLSERTVTVFSKSLVESPHAGVDICRSPYEMLGMFPTEDKMVAGGKTIYETCLPLIDEIILSKIHADYADRADCFIDEAWLLKGFSEDTQKGYIIREASEGKPLVTAHYYSRIA